MVARKRPCGDRREVCENLAGLCAVRCFKPSSRASGPGQRVWRRRRQLQKPWCAAKARKLSRTSAPDKFDLQFATKELKTCRRRAWLSTLRLGRFVWYLVGTAGVRPFFAYPDEPGTMSVWTDADWSGNAVTCRATSAGAVQLESHEIEAWSMIQQMASVSSPRMSSTLSRPRMWTEEKRRIIAGSKSAGLARIPRLVLKMWQSERSSCWKR